MRTPPDRRLAGHPARYSAAEGHDLSARFDGLVKVRLGHAPFGSVIMPELVFVRLGGWRFYQPAFFSPNVIDFDVGPGIHRARFSVDVGGPHSADPARVMLEIRSDGLVRRYEDGAQLYRCALAGPRLLLRHASGRCHPRADDDFDLSLFHVTNPAAFAAIRTSGELRSSRWNLQGTRELANVGYVSLTSLPSIRGEEDLRRIAMSSDGVISFQTSSLGLTEQRLDLAVYRENTSGRAASLPVTVATSLLSPPHLRIHRPLGGPAYYEVVGPEIYRVGLGSGASLALAGGVATASPGSLKRFDYLVVGDAATLEGLRAPLEEEETAEVFHVERLDAGIDLFEFWRNNSNSDQVSARRPEIREFS